jgi:beta-fructofuranosidase
MMEDEQKRLTRRSLLAGSAVLGLPRWMRASSDLTPILFWRLQDNGDFAVESVSGRGDAIASRTGDAIWVGQGRDRALRFDGYSVWLRDTLTPGKQTPETLGDSFTVMAWVALEAYPVSEAAIVQMDAKSGMIFRFSMDRFGYLQCGTASGEKAGICRASEPLAKAQWAHVAASIGRQGITLYRDGVLAGHLPVFSGLQSTAGERTFTVGLSPDCEVIAGVFPTGVINGLLREVQVFDAALSPSTLKQIVARSRPQAPPNLQINGSWCSDDPQRPLCHAQPPRAWTNEPHGLIHWGGEYHLFYQKNPNGPYWSRLNWGHMTSPDLLHWTEMPVALTPELPYESKGCWSGSVIEHEGKLTLIYTGVDEVKAGISLAFSVDGINFTKYAGNPVIPSPPKTADYLDFRDPYLWREGEVYYLIVGSGVKGVGGTALLYRSQDLIAWEYLRQLYTGSQQSSGPFFEMPIFVKDRDRHALIVSELPGRASYWVGSWKDEQFTPVTSEPRHLELFNHLLSPTPMMDAAGQIVVMGIIPDERPVKELWRAGWAHLYSLPRVLTIEENGTISQTPHPCVEALCKPLHAIREIDLEGSVIHTLLGVSETSFRVRATFHRRQSSSVSLLLRRSPDGVEQTEIAYDWEQKRLTLDRTKSSLDPKVRRDRQETEYVSSTKDAILIDVFLDRSVLEVFVDGRASFAARIYPTLAESNGVAFAARGDGARVESLSLSRLERPV